jgi:hypothetical protein
MKIILQSYVQTFINFKSFKVFTKFKSHNMFRTICLSTGVKIYLMRKALLFVAAMTCVGPSDVCCS